MIDLKPTINKQEAHETRDALSDFLDIPQHDLHIIGSGHNYDTANNLNLLLDARKYSLKKVKSLLNLYKSNNRVRGPFQPDYFYFPVGGSGLDYSGSTGEAVAVDVSETYNPAWSLFINRQGTGSKYKGLTRYQFIKHTIPWLINDPEFDQQITSQGQPVAVAGRKLTRHNGLQRILAVRPRKTDGSFDNRWVEVDYQKMINLYPDLKINPECQPIRHPDRFAQCYLNCPTDHISTTEQLLDGTQFHLTTRQLVEVSRKCGLTNK